MKKPSSPNETVVDDLTISFRAYAEKSAAKARYYLGHIKAALGAKAASKPSNWTLIFDTETTTDPGQAFRLGSYQVRENGELREAGIFYEPKMFTAREIEDIKAYTEPRGLKLITRNVFIDNVFYRVGYELRATIVGFNLAFDISRLAIRHASARGTMRGGFTFFLSEDKRNPAIQIIHLSQKVSLIRFSAPFRQWTPRSARKRGDKPRVRRGFFVDNHTFAAALFARSFTLKNLSEFLKVEHPKLSTEEHGGPITPEYLDYAVRDAQTTWECYEELIRRYQTLDLKDTLPPQIYSEASIGKAYLNAMGVKPWREKQWDVPVALLAKIMGCYFGGRSEVRIRRELRQVILCDFLSMYPTVCTLMGLWRFVIASGMRWRDGTKEIRLFLETVTLEDLQKPEAWKLLTTLVRITPDWDILPVRTQYCEDGQATIGTNHLKTDQPLWITLADCIASKLLGGTNPKIEEALIFEPGKPQSGLRPVAIGGNPDNLIDPNSDDFFKRLVELRNDVKIKRDKATASARELLDTEQNAIKIAANATSYGIFVEINVKDRAESGAMTIHTSVGPSYVVETAKDEAPGRFFHPLLATLITGAARLMLAIAERLVFDHELEWVFCDTDSMAIAKPATMSETDFYGRVDKIVAWFSGLNPYEFGGTILKIEDVNFSLRDSKIRELLYCWAISAKRYALFNLSASGEPILRKASAHGLGHLRAPYDKANPAKDIPPPAVPPEKLGVELWQHDLWWKIISAALSGNPDQVDLNYHPALDQAAVSRYAATTPKLLRWFKGFNEHRPYEQQVKPFGFLYSLHAHTIGDEAEHILTPGLQAAKRRTSCPCKPVAPYDSNLANAIRQCFDRVTSMPVAASSLKSYRQVIASYHLHPESKFLNGDYLDRGVTQRRYVFATSVRNIGKEANEWEEQFYLGIDEDAQVDYGLAPKDSGQFLRALKAEIQAQGGQRNLARESGVSRRTISRLMSGKKTRSRIVARVRHTLLKRGQL